MSARFGTRSCCGSLWPWLVSNPIGSGDPLAILLAGQSAAFLLTQMAHSCSRTAYSQPSSASACRRSRHVPGLLEAKWVQELVKVQITPFSYDPGGPSFTKAIGDALGGPDRDTERL